MYQFLEPAGEQTRINDEVLDYDRVNKSWMNFNIPSNPKAFCDSAEVWRKVSTCIWHSFNFSVTGDSTQDKSGMHFFIQTQWYAKWELGSININTAH